MAVTAYKPFFCRSNLVFLLEDSWLCWMLHVAAVCTPCCMLLDDVACCFAKSETGQTFSYVKTDVTTPNNVGSCWPSVLHPFAHGFRFYKFLSLTRGEPNSCVVWAKKFTKRCDPRAEFLPCFLLNRNRLCLLLLVCLFVFFFTFPFFSFLKIPTRVFPMEYLETTYIFFIHMGSSSNSCSLQIE